MMLLMTMIKNTCTIIREGQREFLVEYVGIASNYSLLMSQKFGLSLVT